MNVVTWCHRVEGKIQRELAILESLRGYEMEQISYGHIAPSAAQYGGDLQAWAEEKVYAQEEVALRHMDRLKQIAANAMKLADKWFLVTWRPPHDTKLTAFGIVEEYLRKNYILKWECALEQKGDSLETMGFGAHVHMIVRSQHYPSDFTRNTLTHFGKTGMIQIGNRFCKYLKTAKDLDMAKNYIRGEKHDEAKKAACDIDVLWRAKHKLKELYQSSTDGTVKLLALEPMDWS